MFRFAVVYIILITAVIADELQPFQHEVSLDMCRSFDHRFNSSMDKCMYCAKGYIFDEDMRICSPKGESEDVS